MNAVTRRATRCFVFFVATHCSPFELISIQMGRRLIPELDREALLIAGLKNANVLAGDMYVTMLPKLTPRGPEAQSL
jgi:hypothetical protein